MRYLLLLLALLQFTCAIANSNTITIVGAGISGLSAAHRLHKMGYTCEVYEARGRPGGRVLTAYFSDSSYDELGGKSLYDGGDAKHILALIEELGLQTETLPIHQPLLIVSDGKVHSYLDILAESPEPTPAAFLALKEKIHTFKSLGELIDSFLANHSLMRHVIKVSMTGWEGSSPYILPPEYLEESFWMIYNRHYDFLRESINGFTSTRKMGWVQGGNSRLIEALAKTLEGHIHYQQVLRKITRSTEGKIRLHFDRECVWTDYLILALPCSTLRDVEIEEGIFAEDQMQAIRTLQYGSSAKILLPVYPMDETPTTLVQTGNFMIFLNTLHNTMTFYCAGDTGIFDARSAECTQEILNKEMPSIFQVYPHMGFPLGLCPTYRKDEMFARYDQPVAISWFNEEFSKGSYCNYGLNTFDFFNTFVEEYGETVRKVFRSAANGRIFFAGEHAAPSGDNGTLDGAVNAGERAARMVHASESQPKKLLEKINTVAQHVFTKAGNAPMIQTLKSTLAQIYQLDESACALILDKLSSAPASLIEAFIAKSTLGCLTPPTIEPILNPQDALQSAPKTHQLLFENAYVRILEARIEPGESVPLHTHQWDSIYVILQGSRFTGVDRDSHIIEEKWETGVEQFEGDTSDSTLYTYTNSGTRPFHAIAFEIKK